MHQSKEIDAVCTAKKPRFYRKANESWVEASERWRRRYAEWSDAYIMVSCTLQHERRNFYRAFYGLRVLEIVT
jgi:hypothetical protein